MGMISVIGQRGIQISLGIRKISIAINIEDILSVRIGLDLIIELGNVTRLKIAGLACFTSGNGHHRLQNNDGIRLFIPDKIHQFFIGGIYRRQGITDLIQTKMDKNLSVFSGG